MGKIVKINQAETSKLNDAYNLGAFDKEQLMEATGLDEMKCASFLAVLATAEKEHEKKTEQMARNLRPTDADSWDDAPVYAYRAAHAAKVEDPWAAARKIFDSMENDEDFCPSRDQMKLLVAFQKAGAPKPPAGAERFLVTSNGKLIRVRPEGAKGRATEVSMAFAQMMSDLDENAFWPREWPIDSISASKAVFSFCRGYTPDEILPSRNERLAAQKVKKESKGA